MLIASCWLLGGCIFAWLCLALGFASYIRREYRFIPLIWYSKPLYAHLPPRRVNSYNQSRATVHAPAE